MRFGSAPPRSRQGRSERSPRPSRSRPQRRSERVSRSPGRSLRCSAGRCWSRGPSASPSRRSRRKVRSCGPSPWGAEPLFPEASFRAADAAGSEAPSSCAGLGSRLKVRRAGGSAGVVSADGISDAAIAATSTVSSGAGAGLAARVRRRGAAGRPWSPASSLLGVGSRVSVSSKGTTVCVQSVPVEGDLRGVPGRGFGSVRVLAVNAGRRELAVPRSALLPVQLATHYDGRDRDARIVSRECTSRRPGGR